MAGISFVSSNGVRKLAFLCRVSQLRQRLLIGRIDRASTNEMKRSIFLPNIEIGSHIEFTAASAMEAITDDDRGSAGHMLLGPGRLPNRVQKA